MYTVKQLASLAHISARTLHYYDEIELLKASQRGDNGYRYYDDAALLRLQQILFFKELGVSLEDIRAILDQPNFNTLHALRQHRQSLSVRVQRLQTLIQTVEDTIQHLEGAKEMKKAQLFGGFDEEKQKGYEQRIRELYGECTFDGVKDWNSYTAQQKETIQAEGNANYDYLLAHMAEGFDSATVQEGVRHWHQHLRYFYEPSIERMEGLAQFYIDQPEFNANFAKLHPDFGEFFKAAILHYCQGLRQQG